MIRAMLIGRPADVEAMAKNLIEVFGLKPEEIQKIPAISGFQVKNKKKKKK